MDKEKKEEDYVKKPVFTRISGFYLLNVVQELIE